MKNLSLFSFILALFFTLVACGKETQPPTPKTEPKGEATSPKPSAAKNKKFYWIQPLKGHPVHQLTQIAFREGCRKLGYDCEIIGTDSWDINGTVGLAEVILARGDAAGMAIWTGSPAYNPFIEKAANAGIPVVLPHFPAAEGSIPGATGIICCDQAEYASNLALEIGKAIQGKGAVAVTQGSFNTNENLVAETFAKTMKEKFPAVKVLPAQEEGFEPSQSITKAVSILQANPDIVAAVSTTGGGPTSWASAQKEVGRKIIAAGMDYTRVNLDLVKNGDIFAIVAQPLWEESYGAATLLDKAIRKEKIPWWTKLPAPIVTKDKLAPYLELIQKVEAALKSGQ